MAGGGIWAKIHKWLALLMAVQILFWFASGLFFAAFPIERVRSEHAIAAQPPAPVALDAAAAGLARLAAAGVAAGEKVELRRLLGRPVALLSGGEGRPRLYDLATGRPLSPIADELRRADRRGRPSRRRAGGAGRADRRQQPRISRPAPGLAGRFRRRRRPLALRRRRHRRGNRAALDPVAGLRLFSGACTSWTGAATRISTHPLLVAATALGLVVVVAGIVMFPSRLGLTAWLRRRRARRLSPPSA